MVINSPDAKVGCDAVIVARVDDAVERLAVMKIDW
jgi:hypothetical protein